MSKDSVAVTSTYHCPYKNTPIYLVVMEMDGTWHHQAVGLNLLIHGRRASNVTGNAVFQQLSVALQRAYG